MKTALNARLALSVFVAIAVGGCAQESVAPVATPVASLAPKGMPWTRQADNWTEEKGKLQALGEQYESSWALYEKLRADAQGGQPLKAEQLALPAYNWSGIFTRTKGGLHFDPDLGPRSGPDSAQLTAEGAKVLQRKRDQLTKTVIFSPIDGKVTALATEAFPDYALPYLIEYGVYGLVAANQGKSSPSSRPTRASNDAVVSSGLPARR